jgi:Phospholipid methyltransferase
VLVDGQPPWRLWWWARRSLAYSSGYCRYGSGSGWKPQVHRVGDGWGRFRRCWDSRWRCVAFGISDGGRGTPAPVAPPQRLVVAGFYRYVRNPMYVGFAVGWIGLWIVFGHANPAAIIVALAVALGVHLFVVFYEEPTLRKKFGDDYIEYCRNVRRWWPRLQGWMQSP